MRNHRNYLALREVRGFFRRVGSAGLILPNGWFGRPYDNLFRLTHSEATADALTVELEDRLRLTFTGRPTVSTTPERLIVHGFLAVNWDWIEFGSDVAHRDSFLEGEVQFVTSERWRL